MSSWTLSYLGRQYFNTVDFIFWVIRIPFYGKQQTARQFVPCDQVFP